MNKEKSITAYCLVVFVHHDNPLKHPTYEVLQILSISLTDKTPLRDLFDKTYSNDVKEQFDPPYSGVVWLIFRPNFNGTNDFFHKFITIYGQNYVKEHTFEYLCRKI